VRPVAEGMGEREVEVRGVRLAVEVAGTGPPFVWGHGLTSSRAGEDASGLLGWREVASSGRATLIRYDARGHGRSGATPDPADYRWGALAHDLWGLVDALGLDRPVLGGASMGAATVLHAALARPDEVRALVLVVPPTAWATRAAQAGLYEAGAALIEEAGLDAFLEAAAAAPPPPVLAEHPELVRPGPDVRADVLPSVLRGAAASDLPDRDALATLDRPTLVLAWAGDPGHPVSTAEALAGLLPQAGLAVAEDLDGVRAWVDRVADFLGGLEERRGA
jgi:3-oxoadipate enol-lactonase